MRFAKFAILSMLALFIAASPAVQANGGPSGIVTFTFDDGSPNQYDYAFPVLKEKGLPATLFLNTVRVENPDMGPGLPWGRVREMARSGWEIASHTHNHPDLTSLDSMQLFAELAFSKRRIKEEIGIETLNFASPYGEFNPLVINEVRKHYQSHFRAWGGSAGLNYLPIDDPYDIGRFEVKKEHQTADVCGKMETAAREGKWLVLLFHHVVETEPQEFAISTRMLNELAGCAAALKKEGRIEVQTVQQVLEKHLPNRSRS